MGDVLYGVAYQKTYPHYSLDESTEPKLHMAGLAVPIPYILGGWRGILL